MKTIRYGNLITRIERIKSILAIPRAKKILIFTAETSEHETLGFSSKEETEMTFQAINSFLSNESPHLDLNKLVHSLGTFRVAET